MIVFALLLLGLLSTAYIYIDCVKGCYQIGGCLGALFGLIAFPVGALLMLGFVLDCITSLFG